MSNQTILRSPKDRTSPYKALSRAMFEDDRLSFEARGVLAYLFVKPDNWKINVSDLQRRGRIGRDKAYRIINELIALGYCERIILRGQKGEMLGTEYHLYEEPLPEKAEMVNSPFPDLPDTAEPDTAEPDTENKEHNNKEVLVSNKPTKEEGSVSKKTNQPTNHARAQNGLVGFETQRIYPTFDPLGEDPTTNSQPTDSPPVRAGSDPTAFPPPPALTPAQCLAFRLLAAPEVAAPGGTQVSARYEMNVRRWLTEHDPLWLAQHVAVWWDDYQRGKVDSVGALEHRIEKRCAPNRWPDSFLASAFYRRHYPLDHQAAQARDRAIVYTPHLVDPNPLLDALPVPIWDE